MIGVGQGFLCSRNKNKSTDSKTAINNKEIKDILNK